MFKKKSVWYWVVNILSVAINVLFTVLTVFWFTKLKIFNGNKNVVFNNIFIYFLVAFLAVGITKKLSTNKDNLHIGIAALIATLLIYYFLNTSVYFLFSYSIGLIVGIIYIKKK